MTYTSSTKYIDIETGECLTKNQVIGKNSKYLIIKTLKHATTNWNEGRCYIEYTRQCKKDPRQKFNFGEDR